MNPELERIIEIVAEEIKLNKKEVEELKKEVSYLENAILDVFNSYPDGKIDKASALVYLAYLLGQVIEEDYEFSFFLAIVKGVYDSKKVRQV